MDSNFNILRLALEYIWIPIIVTIVKLWAKLTGLETRSALLEQGQVHYETIRDNNEKHHDAQREETQRLIEAHHKAVMKRMDNLEAACRNDEP